EGRPRGADGCGRRLRPSVRHAGAGLPADRGGTGGGAVSGVAAAFAAPLLAAAAAVLWLRRTLVAVEVHGTSMAPTFHQGDRVLVRRRGLARLRVGDVVVFAPPRLPGEWSRPAGGRRVAGRRWVVKDRKSTRLNSSH